MFYCILQDMHYKCVMSHSLEVNRVPTVFKPGARRTQAGASGFLKINPVRTSVCVFVSAPEAINNQWRDMDLMRLVNKLYSCYMATTAIIVNGRGLGIGTCRRH